MEVKIGVKSVPRELVVETSSSAEEVERALTDALGRDDGVLALTAEKGGKILIPATHIGYLELGTSTPRSIGFGSA